MTSAPPQCQGQDLHLDDLHKEGGWEGGVGEGKHLQKGFLINIKGSIVDARDPSSSGVYHLAQPPTPLLSPDLARASTGMGTSPRSRTAPKVLGSFPQLWPHPSHPGGQKDLIQGLFSCPVQNIYVGEHRKDGRRRSSKGGECCRWRRRSRRGGQKTKET